MRLERVLDKLGQSILFQFREILLKVTEAVKLALIPVKVLLAGRIKVILRQIARLNTPMNQVQLSQLRVARFGHCVEEDFDEVLRLSSRPCVCQSINL